MKSSFKILQSKLELVPLWLAKSDVNHYKLLCDIILKEEGWTEEEYIGVILSRKAADVY